uniref:Uncharacterized protein n=1 Tax=Manihot esculenta TaxID=3983 RepID=A0A2C9U2M0_MANES
MLYFLIRATTIIHLLMLYFLISRTEEFLILYCG